MRSLEVCSEGVDAEIGNQRGRTGQVSRPTDEGGMGRTYEMIQSNLAMGSKTERRVMSRYDIRHYSL